MSPNQRVAYLIELNGILRSSLDLAETMPALARRLVPAFGDWCVVDLAGDNQLERIAAAHTDPAKHALAQQLVAVHPLDADGAWGPAGVLRCRHVLHFRDTRDLALLVPGGDAERLAVVAELGLGSVVSLPLGTADRICGVLTLVREPTREGFRAVDIATLRIIATRTAEAVVHGLLFREVRAASRAKDEFMAMLGHELRNPIAAISHAVRVLDQGVVPEESAARLRAIITRQAQNLARLVDDLLDVARLTSGKITLRRKPVDLGEIARQYLALHEDQDIVLDAESAVVAGDPTRLEQILANLLENAVKYTPRGGRIEVTIRRRDESARLAVRDTGIGISPEMLPRVFDLFAQGVQPLSRDPGGLGIGLTLVKRLVELHGGTVAVASPGAGKGTLVEVTLPLAAAAAAPAKPTATAGVAPARRILIVEDNQDAREALSTLLSGEGHTVEVAEDGPRAVERAGHFRPEVALIDIGLPGMDGYEVARRLRALGGPAIHLVALTGYGQPTDRARAREAGFEIYLVKPVDPEELTRVLADLDRPAASAAS